MALNEKMVKINIILSSYFYSIHAKGRFFPLILMYFNRIKNCRIIPKILLLYILFFPFIVPIINCNGGFIEPSLGNYSENPMNENLDDMNFNYQYNNIENPIFSYNFNPFSSDYSENDLIDGLMVEQIYGITDQDQNIPLNLNGSAKTVGFFVNITDINETKDYINNGQFSSDVSGWSETEETDVNLMWNSTFSGQNGVGQLNLTGLEQSQN